MSAIPSDLRIEATDEAPRRERPLPPMAAAYGIAVAVAALAAAAPFLVKLGAQDSGWTTFAILAAGAAASHTFTVRTVRNSAFHTSWVFLIPAALLLPADQVALLGLVMHIPEWLKERYAWYIQSFNICNYTLGNLATRFCAGLVLHATHLVPDDHLRYAMAGAVACVV